MSLQDWVKNGWLVEHQSSPQEIAELLDVADRDLKECEISGLSPDWKLNIAYNATLQTATAALAAARYRVKGEAHHYRVIQSLAYTIKAGATLIVQFDKFRKKRNISGYERNKVDRNQPIRLPGLKPGVCSGLILSGAFYPDLKIGVWRRRTYQNYTCIFKLLRETRPNSKGYEFVPVLHLKSLVP